MTATAQTQLPGDFPEQNAQDNSDTTLIDRVGDAGVAVRADAQPMVEAPEVRLDEMLIRISEIEVYPEYLDEYLQYALTVGQESVAKEPGVVCIYPMVQQRDSCQIRILEIYADQEAYRNHIQTPHFQTYKQGTLHMVKSLDLVDMDAMNPDVRAMVDIFRKLRTH